MLARKIIPQEISEVLSYCPDTGDFRWLVKAGMRVKKGDIAGSIAKETGYRIIRFNRRNYFAHRIAWFLHYGEQPPAIIDHINRDTRDNRIENLRKSDAISNRVNANNRKCVTVRKPRKGRSSKPYWIAYFNAKQIYDGPDLFEAWCRYKSAENKYWASHQNPTASSSGVHVSK